MNFHSYDYKGHTLVVFPNGKINVHEGVGEVPPTGKLLNSDAFTNLAAAMKFVDGLKTN